MILNYISVVCRLTAKHVKMCKFVFMFNVSLWIARRLRMSGSSGNNLSAGTVIAICGVAISVAVMELTLAVVAGFREEISRKVMGFEPQISVGPPYDYSTGAYADFIRLDDSLSTSFGDFAKIHVPSLSMQMPAMIKTADDFAGVLYQAFDRNHDDSFERDNIVDGVWPDFNTPGSENDLVVSGEIADRLSLGVGDRVYSCFFAEGTMKTRRHTIAGIYESNLGEFDRTMVYASLPALQRVAGVDSLSGTRISFENFTIDEIPDAASALQMRLLDAVNSGELSKVYPVTNVLQTGAVYFNWLSLLDTNVTVIFILMLCVAGFTLISSMFLIMLDRIPTIGLLRSMGASRALICRVFLGMGMKLALAGLVIGDVIGIGLCIIQHYTHFAALDPEMYYLRHVPVDLGAAQAIVLNVAVIIVSALVLLIPSLSASQVAPTSAMKFE